MNLYWLLSPIWDRRPRENLLVLFRVHSSNSTEKIIMKKIISLCVAALAAISMSLSASEQVGAPPTEFWEQPVLSGLEMTPTAPSAVFVEAPTMSFDVQLPGSMVVSMSPDAAPAGLAPTLTTFAALTVPSSELTPEDTVKMPALAALPPTADELPTYTPAGKFFPPTATLSSAALYAPTTAPEGATGATMVLIITEVDTGQKAFPPLFSKLSLGEPAGSAGKTLTTTALPA